MQCVIGEGRRIINVHQDCWRAQMQAIDAQVIATGSNLFFSRGEGKIACLRFGVACRANWPLCYTASNRADSSLAWIIHEPFQKTLKPFIQRGFQLLSDFDSVFLYTKSETKSTGGFEVRAKFWWIIQARVGYSGYSYPKIAALATNFTPKFTPKFANRGCIGNTHAFLHCSTHLRSKDWHERWLIDRGARF